MSVLVRVRVSLGFRDRVRVRVKVRVSFRLATFMYSVSVKVRVSLGFRDRVRVKVRVSFRLAPLSCSVWPPVPHFPYAKPQKFQRPFLTCHLIFIMYNCR